MKLTLAIIFLLVTSTNIKAQQKTQPQDSKKDKGIASFYHPKFEGRKTATGEVFKNKKYTAACNTLQLGTYVKVTNIKNGKSVYVKVNDRMAHNHRMIDLTHAAAEDLNFVNRGTTQVKVEVVPNEEGRNRIIAQDGLRSGVPNNEL